MIIVNTISLFVPKRLIGDKSALVQIMNQWWSSFMKPYGTTGQQWVNLCWLHATSEKMLVILFVSFH